MSKLIERIGCGALTVLLLLFSPGCATYTAPKGWLPMAEQAGASTHGAWLHLEYIIPPATLVEHRGEFIAYGDSAIYIADSGGTTRVPVDRIRLVQMEIYDYSLTTVTTWTVIGVLSTISHGWVGIMTLPMWLITGSASAASISRGGRERELGPDAAWWQEMSIYSRFPQGLPPNAQLGDIRVKP